MPNFHLHRSGLAEKALYGSKQTSSSDGRGSNSSLVTVTACLKKWGERVCPGMRQVDGLWDMLVAVVTLRGQL